MNTIALNESRLAKFFDSNSSQVAKALAAFLEASAGNVSSFTNSFFKKFGPFEQQGILEAISPFANKPKVQLNQGSKCFDLPLKSYQIDSFATYLERQKDPNQKDISNFTITSATADLVTGFVTPSKMNKTYPFNASCKAITYKGFPEVKIIINAPSESRINNCSGIYNFKSPGSPAVASFFVGASSLASGDPRFNPCEGGCYGVFY
ncbi:MAG: hypothetical protein S4CHLAM6_05760 [Chlamydiae bacterium]|nr:hypothetical protein [Chlamydiota bacterium]